MIALSFRSGSGAPGESEKRMSFPTPFHYQDPSSSDLCAYHALVHFLYGSLSKPAFLSQATTYYARELGMERADAKQLAEGGNDMALIKHILRLRGHTESITRQPTDKDLSYYNRILLALSKRSHFITMLKDNTGQWWDYDSVATEPWKIPDVGQFLTENPAYEYLLAK